MKQQPHNFSGGPGALPERVLEQLAEAIQSVDDCGISVLGMSHRSDWFRAVVDEAESHLRALLGLTARQRVVFMQGGGTAQFAMIPMLLARKGVAVEYLHTGYWSGKAIAEARKFADVQVPWSGESRGFRELPRPDEAVFSPEAAYLHYVSNETVEGLRFAERPGIAGVPLICDMSSDFCSGPIDAGAYDLIYAHAQKNLGPAGVTVAVVDERLLVNAPDDLPSVLDYRPQIAAGSIYNTPPVFAIYATLLVLRWLRDEVGGLAAMQAINQRKAAALYRALDQFDDCYSPRTEVRDRSPMNVVFNLRRPEQLPAFLSAARAAGLHGLEGHRSIGGIRASLYNAVSEGSVAALIDFLDRQRPHLA
jgi:phosphoserine aminotransferase